MFCWAGLPVFGIALALSGSRTALLSLLISVCMVLFLFVKCRHPGRLLRYLVGSTLTVSLLLGLALSLLQVLPEPLVDRFVVLLEEPTEHVSWQGRLRMWEPTFSLWTESPLLGWGPAKANHRVVVDNEWLLLLRRYGVVGLTAFLGLFGSLFVGLSDLRRDNREATGLALCIALQATLVGYALYMLTAGVYHMLQLMPITLLFLGLAYSQWLRKPSGGMEGSRT